MVIVKEDGKITERCQKILQMCQIATHSKSLNPRIIFNLPCYLNFLTKEKVLYGVNLLQRGPRVSK